MNYKLVVIDGPKGKIHNAVYPNQVTCKKYVGHFEVASLQSKAETGLWYTLVPGNPHAEQGEGESPDLALQDAIKRGRDRIKKLEQAEATLMTACGL